jgi:hypothetical protein
LRQLVLMLSPQNALAKMEVVPIAEIAKQPAVAQDRLQPPVDGQVISSRLPPASANGLPSVGTSRASWRPGWGFLISSALPATRCWPVGSNDSIKDEELWRSGNCVQTRSHPHVRLRPSSAPSANGLSLEIALNRQFDPSSGLSNLSMPLIIISNFCLQGKLLFYQ